MPKRVVESIAELRLLVGQEIAVSEWVEMTQERINKFAEATGDHQWIHVDVERARRESPFGAPIAHGFLTLSLLPMLGGQSWELREPMALVLNYGANRIRFTHPVPAGSRVRSRTTPLEVSDVDGGWQVRWQVTVDIEGREKPALVAETLTRFYRQA
jgi:acyl dehydratase